MLPLSDEIPEVISDTWFVSKGHLAWRLQSHAAVVRVGRMIYACDDDACESFRQFVESHSYPHYLVYVVFYIM